MLTESPTVAILVETPAKDAQLDFSKAVEITWSSVSTDPDTFEIDLVDQTTMGSIVIASSVNTADGKYTFTNFVAGPGPKYRFNLIAKTASNTGILAQSQEFAIIKSGGKAASNPSPDASAVATMTTSTVSGASGASGKSTPAASTDTSSSQTTMAPANPSTSTTSNSTGTRSTASPTASGNAAAVVGKTFGLAGPILAVLYMFL
jgi:hypothetical protein